MPLKRLRTQVIPDGWAAHHRPVVEGSFTATCMITSRADGPPIGFDEPVNSVVAHSVPCRVQQQNAGAAGALVAGQELTVRQYLIVVPADLDLDLEWQAGTTGHQVMVTSVRPDGDPHLVGRRFDVDQVLTGSEVWERDLLCTDNQTQNTGRG